MAVVGAIGFAAGLAQTLFSALQTTELKEMCSMFSCETERKKLENTMSTISDLLLDVDAKRQELTNEGRNWIEKLKEAVYDIDDLLDEFLTIRQQTQNDADFRKKVGKFFSRNNNYFVAFNVSREIKKLRKRLDDIAKDHTDFGFTDVNKHVIREETCSMISEIEVIGREEDKGIIVGMLLSDGPPSDQNVSFVNIVGVAGLGKTTLAQLVYNDERVIEAFSKRIWVCVSEEFGPKEILGKILGKEVSTLDVAYKEVRSLLETKRFLLVLDDVWNESHEEWRKLKPYLVSNVSASKVITTSRSKKVATSTGDDSVMYELQHLSKENSWSLFELIAFGKQGDHQVDPDIVEIGRDIVKKCANVPLSIKVIASLLHGQGKNTWETFQRIDLAEMSDEDDENSIMPTLMFSYYQLTLKLKSCFSFCSLFPKDYIIRKELLINLWLAQGYLVDPNNNARSLEEVGEHYLTILSNRCFFQDIKLDEHGDVESFKMHDLMHDLALKVAGNESLIMSPTTKNHLGKKIRHLSRERGSSNLCLSNKLRTYIWLGGCNDYYSLNGNFEVSSLDEVTQIVSKCKRLRVLSLPKFGIGGTFSDKVGRLLQLRYLDLSGNKLEMLPKSITKLHNLQILKLCKCEELKELPEDIMKLVNLRTLDISSCKSLKELPEDMSKLINLRTLDTSCNLLTYMPRGMCNLTKLQRLSDFVVGGVDVKQIEGSKLVDLQALKSLKGDLHIRVLNFSSQNMPHATKRAFLLQNARLKSLWIDCSGSYDQSEVHETLVEDLCPNDDICNISMVGYQGTKMPRWASLEYSDMEGLQHVTSLSRFSCLKRLELSGLPNVEYIMEIENDAAWESRTLFFPVLEKLYLHKMPKLKGWWRGLRWREMEGGAGCLVDNSGLEHAVALPCFPQLRELDISECESMTYFPPCPHVKQLKLWGVNEALTFCMKGGASSSNVSTSSSSCLEYMSISNARVMNAVLLSEFAEGGVIELVLMHDYEVKSMGTLREVFERVGCRLKTLLISNCKELEIEDEEEEGMPWKYLQSLSSLKLLFLPKMVKLPKGLCYLTSLQSLEIRWCSNLEEVGECIGSLTSLQSLTLTWCDKLKGLPECIGFLTSLQYLFISAQQLESLPESMRDLTSLSTLRISTANDDIRKKCLKPDGEYWPRISHIPHLIIRCFPLVVDLRNKPTLEL